MPFFYKIILISIILLLYIFFEYVLIAILVLPFILIAASCFSSDKSHELFVRESTSKFGSNVYKSTKISLELKSIQSREFSANKKVVFASVLSVFQDYGYSISAADISTGLITAKSKTQFSRGRDINSDSREFSSKFITYYIATAFVEEYTFEITKARLNFIIAVQIINANGAKSFKENTVEDSAFYNNAFVKIQEEIFLRININ